MRAVVQQNANPPYDKAQTLRLYTEKVIMDALVSEDTQRYRQALEAAGDIFGGIEPVQRFHEAFQRPLDAAYAAASVGLETETFLAEIRENVGLQNLGLLVLETGTVKRDTWTSNFGDVVAALNSPDSNVLTPVTPQVERIPGGYVHIPDPNLRAVLTEVLGISTGAPITAEEMATLQTLQARNKNISDLTGLEFAKNLTVLNIRDNPLSDLSPLMGLAKLHYIHFQNTEVSDLSPLASLTKLREIQFRDTEVADLSPLSGLSNLEVINASETRITALAPLARLKNLQKLDTVHSDITDLSPLAGLTNLTRLRLYDCKATDLSPLKGLTKLKWFGLTHTDNISDLSPLSGLTNLEHLDLANIDISDISALAGLVNLETLILNQNRIIDVSPLVSLHNLKNLQLHNNNIADFSSLGSHTPEYRSIRLVWQPGVSSRWSQY